MERNSEASSHTGSSGTSDENAGNENAGGPMSDRSTTGTAGGSQGTGVADVKETARQTVQETKDAAVDTAQQIKGDVQAQATELAGEAKQQAGELIGQAKEQAASAFGQQREQAVSGLAALEEALRSTAQNLKDSGDGAQSGIGQFVDEAADRLAQSAEFLRDKDANEILHDLQDFARKQPVAFVGAAVGVGILAARLLKGSGSGSASIDRVVSSASEQAVSAMDVVKDRVSDAAASARSAIGSDSDKAAGSSSPSGFGLMDDTASTLGESQSTDRQGRP